MNDPSPWLRRWVHLLPAGGTVLDVAAGEGRHARWLAARGQRVTAVDRDAAALASIGAGVECIVADLEAAPWPLGTRSFDAVAVFNYLWRPLVPALLSALAPGGLLLVETFAAGNETVGRPRRADFLLARAELLELAEGLRIVAYEDVFLDQPARFVQRLVAAREVPATLPHRYPPGSGVTHPGSLESADSASPP